jgi:hypothetical protein
MKQKNKISILKYSAEMKKHIFILLMIFSSMSLIAQSSITFEYDDAGNRVRRYSICSDQSIDLGPDVSISSGQTYTIYAAPGFVSYTWNGIEGSNTLDVFTGGTYKLEAVAEEGCLCIDEIVVTENVQEFLTKTDTYVKNVNYDIFPNPTEGVFYFTASNMDNVERIDLYNIHGSLIQTFTNISNFPFKIDISGQTRGLYLLRVSEGNSYRQFKIVYN